MDSTQALGGIVGIYGPAAGSGSLRATAGQLSEDSGQELAAIVFRYWNRDEKTDLMRFHRLSVDKKDYLIYATQLTGDLVLILIYDTNAPLSQIRPQTKILAEKLANRPPASFAYARPGIKPAEIEQPEGRNPGLDHPAAIEDPKQPEPEEFHRTWRSEPFKPAGVLKRCP